MHEDAFIHINHRKVVALRYTHDRFLHTVHTHAQLKLGPRWCFCVCVALGSVRMPETSAPQGLGERWGRLVKANETTMISD